MKRTFTFLLLFFLLLYPFNIASAANENVVKSLEVGIQVQNDGLIQVVETMRLEIQKDKPFIIRLHNSFDMQTGDGSSSHFEAPVQTSAWKAWRPQSIIRKKT